MILVQVFYFIFKIYLIYGSEDMVDYLLLNHEDLSLGPHNLHKKQPSMPL